MQSFLLASSVLLWVVVLFNLLLTLALVRKLNLGSQMEHGLKPGKIAPNFTAQTMDGETITLAHYAGRQVAFLFIGPHCGSCRNTLHRYKELYAKARQAGVDVVLVSNAGLEETRLLVEEFQLDQPVLMAPQGINMFMADYKAPGTPFYCAVDADGKVESAGYPDLERGYWKKLAEKSTVTATNSVWKGGELTLKS